MFYVVSQPHLPLGMIMVIADSDMVVRQVSPGQVSVCPHRGPGPRISNNNQSLQDDTNAI